VGLSLYMIAADCGFLMFYALLGMTVFWFPTLLALEARAVIGTLLLLLYMRAPLEGIFAWLPSFGQASVALGKIEELGLSLTGGEDVSREILPETVWQSVELDHVTHCYRHDGEQEEFVLGPVNATFVPGELVFVTGGNGSGKSTLAKLFMGLYEPEAGTIRLDGDTITQSNIESYRQMFSAVFSDFYLFEHLVGASQHNIDGRAQELLSELQLNHKVSVHNGVLSTTELSSGQRKRLALLTAYLEDRPIYVFDEWAADQDPVFREVFYTQILQELRSRGKLIICITHDDRYFHVADRMIKLDYGQVVSDERSDSENVQTAIPVST